MYLFNIAEKYGDHIALEVGDEKLTFDQLLKKSHALASSLLENKPSLMGERVISIIKPSFDYVILQWAVWRVGGIFVPLPEKLTNSDLSFYFNDIDPSLIIIDKKLKSVISPLAKDYDLKIVEDLEINSNNELPKINMKSPCMFLYTSGTTGKPKGVILSHANLEAQIVSLQKAWEWSEKDKILLTLPLYHVHGIVNVLMCSLASGATCVIHSKFDSESIWNEISKSEITLFMAVPTIYAKLIEWYDDLPATDKKKYSKGISNLRLTVSGSAALSISLFDKWFKISNIKMLERYGMTETGMILSNPIKGLRKKGSVGKPLPGVSVLQVDEQLVKSKPGDSGEILVKGDSVFKGYWKRKKETKESFYKGWFRTGDLAVVEDRYFRLLGRISQDIIKTAGHKISSLEIEEKLREHDQIKDAAVVSIPDETWGELVCAAIIRLSNNLTEEKLHIWIKDYFISYKRPRKILFLDDFPRNNLGKVIKEDLKVFFIKN